MLSFIGASLTQTMALPKFQQAHPDALPKPKVALRDLPVRCTQTGAQLPQRFQVARMRVRDAWHLQNLWTTKILAHTVCLLARCAQASVFLNIQLQRDPLDFEGLVRF